MKRFKVSTRDDATGRFVRSQTIRAETAEEAAETAARRRYRLPSTARVLVSVLEPRSSTGTGLGVLSAYLSGAERPAYGARFWAMVEW